MEIIGVAAGGTAPLFTCTLGHGDDPDILAWNRGYRIIRPLSVTGEAPHLTVTLLAAPHGQPHSVLAPPRVRTMDVAPWEADRAEVKQRLAAYAIVHSPRGLLATQFSDLTAVSGQWGLPGGGIDHGENPAQTIIREALEETGQHIEISQLLELHTDHWIGRAPNGAIEDFHAVRLIYAARCPEPTEPIVHDIGGTTEASGWVPLFGWTNTDWIASVRTLIAKHLPTLLR